MDSHLPDVHVDHNCCILAQGKSGVHVPNDGKSRIAYEGKRTEDDQGLIGGSEGRSNRDNPRDSGRDDDTESIRSGQRRGDGDEQARCVWVRIKREFRRGGGDESLQWDHQQNPLQP